MRIKDNDEQMAPISVAKHFRAWKLLSTYLDISAIFIGTIAIPRNGPGYSSVTVSAVREVIEVPTTVFGGSKKSFDARPFAEKLRVNTDPKSTPARLPDRLLQLRNQKALRSRKRQLLRYTTTCHRSIPASAAPISRGDLFQKNRSTTRPWRLTASPPHTSETSEFITADRAWDW